MQVIALRDLPPGSARVVSVVLASGADGPRLGVVAEVDDDTASVRWLRLPTGDAIAARDLPIEGWAYPVLAADLNAVAYIADDGGDVVIERPFDSPPVRHVVTDAELNSMAFTPDGGSLYGVSDDGVSGWYANGERFLYNSEGGSDGRASAAAGSGMYAMAHFGGHVSLHYASDWSGGIDPPTGDSPVTALAFTNASGDRLVVAHGRVVGVYAMTYEDRDQDFFENYLVFALPEHPAAVTGIAFTADGAQFATSCADGVIRLWDAETGAARETFDWQVGELTAVAFSPDGHLGAAGTADGRVVIWDMA